MRNGCIQVQVPKRWSQRHKASVAEELARKVKEREEERRRILQEIDLSQSPRVTIETNEALQALVDEINAQTFRIDGVRAEIGSSRYTRLAQMNIRTRVMRVSRFSLRNVPQQSLRYLLVHELAHCLEANHNKRFWKHVERFVPDYERQSRIIRAVHAQSVADEERLHPAPPPKKRQPRPLPTPPTQEEWARMPDYIKKLMPPWHELIKMYWP
ncbi:MAG: M48 family metallopeptidase [Vampirovibrionales bacterium]|nr:M48 family metallopeptidase [Vampirovibrionales bacterium]